MKNNFVIWLWGLGVLCMQIIPWSISGIFGIFQKIPEKSSTESKSIPKNNKFLSDLFQNQIAILFSVPIGIILLDQVEDYGLIPSLPFYYYLASPVFGAFLIWFGIQSYKFLAKFMKKYIPTQLEHDSLQYQYNIKALFEKKTWERLTLGLFNGFSEEMLMRVFLMGFMINQLNINPIIVLFTSLFFNGLHHTRQGRILGSTSIMIIQFFFALSYLLFNDYLFIGIMHMATDMTGLILPNIMKKKNDK